MIKQYLIVIQLNLRDNSWHLQLYQIVYSTFHTTYKHKSRVIISTKSRPTRGEKIRPKKP